MLLLFCFFHQIACEPYPPAADNRCPANWHQDLQCKNTFLRDWQSKETNAKKMKFYAKLPTRLKKKKMNSFTVHGQVETATDNQLRPRMNGVLYKRLLNFAGLTPPHTFLLLAVFQGLSWNSYGTSLSLFICLCTRSPETAVLFLLSSCVVLVLHSYQESTLLWRPWIPLIKIKLGVLDLSSRLFISRVTCCCFCSTVWLFQSFFVAESISKIIRCKKNSFRVVVFCNFHKHETCKIENLSKMSRFITNSGLYQFNN